MVKMKVTTQGEEVINLLWDVIAAKGFEKDMYFETAARDIRALPKLEGTVHVNIALIVKFMQNYFFNPAEYPAVPRRDDAGNDDFLFDQGPTKGLGKIRFHDYRPVYDGCDLPNVQIFTEQIAVFREFLRKATPDEAQQKDIDFLLAVGEIFTLVVYGQLILENAALQHRRRPRSTRSSTSWCATSPSLRCSSTASPPARSSRWLAACGWCARRMRMAGATSGSWRHTCTP